MSEIRLRQTGLVIFFSRMFSIGTGVLYVLLITRNISTEEFGIWGNINDVLQYFIIPSFILPFWAGRFIARGHTGSARTGVVANLMTSSIVFTVYLVLAPMITSLLHISKSHILSYTLVSLQILESYALQALEAVLYVKKPHMIAFSSATFEASKVVVGFALIPWLKLLGAISAMLIASFVQIMFYLILTVDELRGKVNWSYTKQWLGGSFFNLFSLVGQGIGALNLIILFVLGGEQSRGFYGAAQTVASVVGYSASLGFALYPKLLSEKSADDASTSLKMILMFAIPMAVGAITLSESYLTVLSPQFAGARFVLAVLALGFLGWSVSTFLDTVVYGTERIDEEAKISIKRLLGSRMFLLATLPYIYSALVLPTMYFVLASTPRGPFESALYFSLIDFAAGIALLIIRYGIASKCLSFSFSRTSVAKYCLASAIMALILIAIPRPTRLSLALIATLIGAATYFGILYIIDREARDIMKLAAQKVQESLGLGKQEFGHALRQKEKSD